jgi:hypothetical protein
MADHAPLSDLSSRADQAISDSVRLRDETRQTLAATSDLIKERSVLAFRLRQAADECWLTAQQGWKPL